MLRGASLTLALSPVMVSISHSCPKVNSFLVTFGPVLMMNLKCLPFCTISVITPLTSFPFWMTSSGNPGGNHPRFRDSSATVSRLKQMRETVTWAGGGHRLGAFQAARAAASDGEGGQPGLAAATLNLSICCGSSASGSFSSFSPSSLSCSALGVKACHPPHPEGPEGFPPTRSHS